MDLRNHITKVLPPQEMETVVMRRKYSKGEYIYIPPNKPNEMHQLVSGVVKIGSYTIEGEEVCYDFLTKQEVFGNLRFLEGQFYEFAKAVTDCELTVYELQFFKKLIVHDPTVAEWFIQSVISRWCRMETRLFKICTLPPRERVLSLFQELNRDIIDPRGKTVFLPTLLTDVEISQLTGLTRQTVSKLLRSYQRVHGEPLFKRKKIRQQQDT